MKKLIIASISIMLCTSVYAGPFGFNMGEQPPGNHIFSKNGRYIYKEAPRMHPDITVYSVQASEKYGICMIKGNTDSIEENGYGTRTKMKLNELKDQLISKYGQPSTEIDYVVPSVFWNEDKYFKRAIQASERQYGAIWSDLKKEGIDSIAVAVMATSSYGDMYVTIEFYFENYEACKAELESKKSEVF